MRRPDPFGAYVALEEDGRLPRRSRRACATPGATGGRQRFRSLEGRFLPTFNCPAPSETRKIAVLGTGLSSTSNRTGTRSPVAGESEGQFAADLSENGGR